MVVTPWEGNQRITRLLRGDPHRAIALPFFERTSSANLQSRSAVNAGNEQNIRDFFYFKKRDPVAGAVSKVQSGYFMNDSEYARLHTEQRVGLTKANTKELEQWSSVSTSSTFMAWCLRRQGAVHSGYPLNGLKGLAGGVIVPFIERMAAAGNRPTVKIYPDTGRAGR
jgi:hypothetical protein